MEYTWVLIKKKNSEYLGWSKAKDKPLCGEPDKLEWVEWGEKLPKDIETEKYLYKNGKLIK